MTDTTARSPWGLRLLWVLTIIVVIIVVVIYVRVDDCCREGGGPGRGPIIILEPTSGSGGSVVSAWKMGSSSSTAPPITTWGASGQLREDVFGMIEMFVAADTATPTAEFPVTKSTLVVNTGGSTLHSLVMERTTAGAIAWAIDGNPLVACDFSSAAAPPNCTGSGIPPEFNGTIISLTTEPSTSTPAPGVVTTVVSVKIQAKQ